MLEWLRFIAEFFLHSLQMIGDMFLMAVDSFSVIGSSFAFAPTFLFPILTCTLSVAIIMWVVNLF